MDMARKVLIFGDADSVGERVAEAVGMGLDGIPSSLAAPFSPLTRQPVGYP